MRRVIQRDEDAGPGLARPGPGRAVAGPADAYVMRDASSVTSSHDRRLIAMKPQLPPLLHVTQTSSAEH